MAYRVWAAATGGDDLVAQGEHTSLDAALGQAHALAVSAVVAVELPGRRWHTFKESGTAKYGPIEEQPTVDPSERRRSQRFSTAGMSGEAVSHLGDGTPVRVLDVSEDGAQLQLPKRYRTLKGRDVSLRIRGKRGVVQVNGKIAWVHRQRCGIAFDWDQTPTFAKTYIRGLIADVG